MSRRRFLAWCAAVEVLTLTISNAVWSHITATPGWPFSDFALIGLMILVVVVGLEALDLAHRGDKNDLGNRPK